MSGFSRTLQHPADLNCSVVAISIARLTYLVHNDSKSEDVTWNFVDIEIWTMLELGFAILSGASRYKALHPCDSTFSLLTNRND